jgi:sortase B
MRGKFETRKKKAPFWYNALLILLVGVFAASAWHLADYFLGSREQADAYDDLADLVEANRPALPDVPDDPGMPDASAPLENAEGEETPVNNAVDENGILLEYAPLYEMNPDMVGWLQIEGTRINYPVMQTPDRPDYYLKRNFKGEANAWGCIYAREECNLEEPSDNITIYGHNMKDGSMLAGLHAYAKREFWEDHRYVQFDTLREHHTYAIFAVFTTTASAKKGFEYHEFIDADDEKEFDTFVARCLSLSLYGTDIVPEYGDKIICLSTCEYSQTNGRLVVAAVRID